MGLAQAAQTGLLKTLHMLGLVDIVAGQPAWPFGVQLATQTLWIDHGLARQFACAVAFGACALVAVLVGALWRRGRGPLWALTAAGALMVPWPPSALVWTTAVPTSFHRSTSHFEADRIARGLMLYSTHCASCHGADGRGEGPAAADLPVWPPTLSAGLLWKRPEGELLWSVLHGMTNAAGLRTMPGFASTLNENDVWALLDGMKALSAGDSAHREAQWQWPVSAPDIQVGCSGAAPQPLAHWHGQRIRIVALDLSTPPPREDPRFVTVILRREHMSSPVDCGAEGAAAWRAYASLAGATELTLPGTQFIVDRSGWLRALARPGQSNWSEDNLLCRSSGNAQAPGPSRSDGLTRLLASIDADPVRIDRLGGGHGP